ncbi:MAG: hypothetical protein WD738_14775 [Pirellulales bacterium]
MAAGESRFDVSDPRFEASKRQTEPEYAQPVAPPRKRSRWTTCLIGCLVIVVVAVLLFAAAASWVWRNWRDLTAIGATEMMNQVVENTELPPEERREINVEIGRVADAFREGKLSYEQMMRIVREVANSPLLPLFVVSAVDKHYFERSGLSAEEKAEGRRTLQRFVRGAVDHKIDQQAVDAVLAQFAERQGNGNWQLRERVSDAELRAALAEAKRAADAAKIPEQPESVDASAEFRRIVDEALEGK